MTDKAPDTWGFADVEAAVDAVTDWIELLDWKGPSAEVDRWLVTGHSNGGEMIPRALEPAGRSSN